MYAFVYDLAQPLNANHRNIFYIQRALPVGSKHLFEVNWTQKGRLLTTEFSFGSFKKFFYNTRRKSGTIWIKAGILSMPEERKDTIAAATSH